MTRIILLIPLLAVLLSCGQGAESGDGSEVSDDGSTPASSFAPPPTSSVAPPPMVPVPPPTSSVAPPAPSVSMAIPLPEAGDLLLEEKIIIYNTVVQATMTSVSSEVVLASDIYRGTVDSRYRVVLKFNLTVHEYLKGSGPENITAVWLGSITHETSAQAESARTAIVQRRDTQWDDKKAVVFLTGNHGGNMEAFGTVLTELLQRNNHFYFSSGARYSHADDRYSLHSPSRVLWFPEQPPSGSASSTYMMSLPPNSQSVSLGDLKRTIASVATELAKDNSEGYQECVVKKYEHMRNVRNWPIGRGLEYTNWDLAPTIGSGLPVGTETNRSDFLNPYPDPAPTWLDGTDSALFSVYTGPSTTDEGFDGAEIISTTRPLPGGEYSFDIKESWPVFKPCNYVVSNEVRVTVTASGALHEFFFDPVTVGSAVAADASNGVLKPTSFTDTDGATATVESISYEPLSPGSEPAPGSNRGQAGKVKVKVVPWDALSGVLDVIELDGTVSASLRVANSSVDLGSNTFTWSVPSQPWHDGDKLMVRIRRSAPFATAPHGLTSTNVGRDSISLSWDSVNGVTGHVVERRVSGDPGWETLDAEVTEKSYTASGLSCGTSYEFRVGAYGDGTRFERVTGPVSYATLSETTDECSAQGSPVFASAAYSFSIVEDAPAGSTVGAVSATDPENDTVTYSISSGNEAGKFAIDGSSGRITLAGTLDHDTASSHALTAQADDGNGGRGTATVTVSVEQASCSNGTAVPGPSDNTGLVDDCLKLLSARDALEGTAILNWSADLAIGSWQGVGVTGTPGRVQSLSLSGLELDGAVPSGLGDLAELRTLELSGNDLTGAVPSSLGKLSRLTRLHLHGNDLSGMIPSELGGLSGLEELRMSENRLTGSIPTEMGNLSSLNRLSLDDNRLTGSIPASLGRLSDLHTLALADNGLSGTIPVGLGGLAQLRYLSLGGNDLTGSVPSQLGSLGNLRYLYLDQNDLTGGIPTQLGGLGKLEILHLYGNGLTGGIPSTLGGLSKLEELALSRNVLTGSIPSELEGLSKLVYLTLRGNNLTGCIPSGLRSVTDSDLDRLGLAYCAAAP